MRHLRRFGDRIGALARDRGGNFVVLFGFVASSLLMAAGFAIDTVQIVSAKSALRAAVDSAVTSTARGLTLGDTTEEEAPQLVQAFLAANGSGSSLPAAGVTLDSLVIDKTKKTVEVAAHVDVALYFPLFGLNTTRRISETGAAVYSDRSIEVAMMLDVTGSMAGQKIIDLRNAASNAVEALLGGQNPDNPRVRAAIVPYAEAVNTGGLKDTVFVEKAGGSNLPPSSEDPVAVSATPAPDKCATERKTAAGAADFSEDGPYSVRYDGKGKPYPAKVNRDDRLKVCPKAELVPLTADKKKLLGSIKAFKADGVTAGGIAAQWGYYMLSPQWRPAIVSAGLGDGPADYDSRKVAKVAILMTDGQFNTAFAGVKDGDNPRNAQQARSRANAEAICANMKASGIEVYTIGFALGSSEKDQARAVLKTCASTDSGSIRHFFDVSTGPELDSAFAEIIRNTERLALTR